jgi:hypothetical protein
MSPELLVYRAAREQHAEVYASFDDDRLDILCGARERAIMLSGKHSSAFPRVPAKVEGQHVSTSLLVELSAKWRSQVPASKRKELDEAWMPMGASLGTLVKSLHDHVLSMHRAAGHVQDVLADDTADTIWRMVDHYRAAETARSGATYQVDELLVLGYSAAVVHRYRCERRDPHSFETWALCTEEGSRVARWQAPIGYKADGAWHQLLVPLIDIKDDDEPDQQVLRLTAEQCIERRRRAIRA